MNVTDMPPALARALVRATLRLPAPALARLGGERARAEPYGQRLDAQLAAALMLNDRFGLGQVRAITPAEMRVISARGMAPFGRAARPMDEIRELRIERGDSAVAARLYRPARAPAGAPAIVYYHGGGGVIGSMDEYDPVATQLAEDTGYAVVSVDYRLSPEHLFPTGVEDAIAAYLWVREHAAALGVNGERVAVAGDSMGGNFAAVVCQQALRRNLPLPALQVLLYPALDCSMSSPSHTTLARGYLLTRALMRWFQSHYLPDREARWDERASPLLAVSLAGLPPAVIVTAGFDPLRDEGALYAERLARAGVPVQHRCEPGLIHGYVAMSGAVRAAREALVRMHADIRAQLGS